MTSVNPAFPRGRAIAECLAALIVGPLLIAGGVLQWQLSPTLAIFLASMGLVVTKVFWTVRNFWQWQFGTYSISSTSIVFKRGSDLQIAIPLSEVTETRIVGPFGERYSKPTGGYGLVVLQSHSKEIAVSPQYASQVLRILADRGINLDSNA